MEISADTNTLAVSTGCDSPAIVRACRVTRLYFVRDAPGPYRVYAPPNSGVSWIYDGEYLS